MDTEFLKEILAEVKDIKAGVDRLETRVTRLETEVADIKTEVAVVKAEVADIKAEVAEVKDITQNTNDAVTLLENTLPNKIDLLFDGHQLSKQKLDDHENRIIKVEKTVSDHTFKITALRG